MTDRIEQDAGDEPSLGESVERLIGSARELADAELTLAKARGGRLATATKWIAIWGVVAFITAFGMIVTLMIGAVLALAPLWGLGIAVLAVTGVALLAIILCLLAIKAQIGRIKGALS